MSTRGALAIVNGDGWRGRYNHSDSYPTHLGRVAWQAVTSFPTPAEGVKALEEFLTTGPGRFGISFIESTTFLQDQRLISWDHKYGGPYDGTVRVYNRPGECDDSQWVDSCDLFIEWAYVFSDKGVMVLQSVKGGALPDNFGYGTQIVGFYPFDAGEPDWDEVETKGDELVERAYQNVG